MAITAIDLTSAYQNPKPAIPGELFFCGHLTLNPGSKVPKNDPTTHPPKLGLSSGLLGQNRVISKASPEKEIRISASVVGGNSGLPRKKSWRKAVGQVAVALSE